MVRQVQGEAGDVRGCIGKTTLARIVGSSRGYRYVTFDDDVVRSAAQDDPLGFAASLPERVILDEVQKAPALFPALKIEIDRRRITAGGYPAALTRPPGRRRANWYHDQVAALVQRDVRDLARIRQLETLPRVLAAAAGQNARMFNVSDLAAPFEVSRPTIRDYLTLLERVFLLERLPAWHSNRLTRLVKRPKLHLGDTGVASALLGLDAPALAYDRVLLGQLLETFVLQELRRQASWHDARMSFHHFRDKDGAEVDIVIERGATAVAGVEVKASGTVRSGDFRGLRKLRGVLGDRFASGVVLYDGEATVPFGDRLYGVPVRRLWG